jgi:carbohydrate diacid regulator
MPLEERFLRIADRFLELIKRETGRNTIICDEHGIIVRSSIPSRVGDEHIGAKRIMRHEMDEYFVTAEEAAANPAVREGMNVPIVVGGRRVATFGIAGTPETSRPLV